jgi:RNA-directed DNA polymerase
VPEVTKGTTGRVGNNLDNKPAMDTAEQSDRAIVPKKAENERLARAGVEDPLEGRARTKENAGQTHTDPTQSGSNVPTGLERVRQKAKEDKGAQFTNLLHHITVDLLRQSYLHLQRKAAPGVDGMTWKEYETGLEDRLRDLHGRVHRGAYRALPSRRVYIPKADGQQRPLGIAALEDKIVQQAVVEVLNAIFENEFLGFSYGFRPGRGPHDALDALNVALMRRVNWVLDADIRGFFDNMSHEWTMKFVQRRVADPRLLRLIQKWLKAGVSEDGQWSESKVGTPQGAVISPLLANIYLHYVLDEWAHEWRGRWAAGEVYLLRYADDAVFLFQYEGEARAFLAALRKRLAAHGLELHPAKTRLIEFGRFAESNRRERGEGPPESFDFLGFTHLCGVTKGGAYQVKRRTAAKRMRQRLASIGEELRRRMHEPVRDTGAWLRRVVSGYYRYHCVAGNLSSMAVFRHRLKLLWRRVLRNRGDKGKVVWTKFARLTDYWIPHATIMHPLPQERFAVKHPRWKPDAGKPHVRFCPGGAS